MERKIVPEEHGFCEPRIDREAGLADCVLGGLLKTTEGGALVRVHVEYGEQLRELEQIVDFFGEVQQFELTAAASRGGVRADELADAGAVNVIHVRKVENDFGAFVVQQTANRGAQQGASLSKRNLAA